MKHVKTYESFLNEERAKNILDLEKELDLRNISYTEIE